MRWAAEERGRAAALAKVSALERWLLRRRWEIIRGGARAGEGREGRGLEGVRMASGRREGRVGEGRFSGRGEDVSVERGCFV